MSLKILLLGLGLVTILVVAGCSSTVSTTGNVAVQITGQVKEVRVDASNWKFDQEQVQVNKGDKVRLTLTSSEGTHGITIPGVGISTGPVSPGQEKVVEFIATESGNLGYYCNVPCGIGHSNMRGQLSVN